MPLRDMGTQTLSDRGADQTGTTRQVEPSIEGSIQSIHQDTADSFKCIEPGEHVT